MSCQSTCRHGDELSFPVSCCCAHTAAEAGAADTSHTIRRTRGHRKTSNGGRPYRLPRGKVRRAVKWSANASQGESRRTKTEHSMERSEEEKLAAAAAGHKGQMPLQIKVLSGLMLTCMQGSNYRGARGHSCPATTGAACTAAPFGLPA